MNAVDIVILVVVGISVIYGIYRGFLQTVLSVLAVLVSLFLALTFSPRLADVIQGHSTLTEALASYTDAVSRVGDVELARTEVDGSETLIDRVIEAVKLPTEIAEFLRTNMRRRAAEPQDQATVNDVVRSTLVTAAVDVLAFVLCFFGAMLVFSLLISLIRHVTRFPALKTMDGLAGGLFGLARGILIVYVLFLLLPVAETVVPGVGLEELVRESKFGALFRSGGFFAGVLNGKL